MSEVRTALYRHWDADGNLLYVGISLSAIHRLTQHKRDSHWHDDIANMTVEWFDSRAEALVAEREAIRTERPRFNKVHNAANDNQPKVETILLDGWSVYLVRNIETKTLEGVYWAASLANLWDVIDEDFDPCGFEFAELSQPGGLTVGSAPGVVVAQHDDILDDDEDIHEVPWGKFTATELFDSELRNQSDLEWVQLPAADEDYGMIARIFNSSDFKPRAA